MDIVMRGNQYQTIADLKINGCEEKETVQL
jgi:hypothetical protein